MKHSSTIIPLLALGSLILLSACSPNSNSTNPTSNTQNSQYPEEGTPSPAYGLADILLPSQPGQKTFEKNGVIIDYSNAEYGYVSVKAPDSNVIQKLQVLSNDFTYTYDLVPNEYVIVPLQQGSNTYTVRALKNTEGSSYAIVASTQIEVNLEDELSPYLYPNQIVDYDEKTLAVLKSFELTLNADSDIKRVYEIYTYITENITYDYDKAEIAKTTFILPIVDETYIQEKGICFDYAALMSAMLRVQHIPTRVVTGVTDLGYHAWVEVYLSDQGWINPSIYFASKEWKLVDPTFDSMGVYDGTYQTKDYY